MRFKLLRTFRSLLFVWAIALTSGCGLLGEKRPINQTPIGMDQGCFDDLGKRLEKYFEGQIDEGEWVQTWTCLNSSLQMFSDYAVGSVPGGYTHSDIQKFSETFLIKQQSVPVALVESMFIIKAIFIGGNTNVLTPEEVRSAIAYLDRFKFVSARLLPHLRDRKNSPLPNTLMAFSKAFVDVNDEMADFIPKGPKIVLTSEQLDLVLTEFKKFFDLAYPDGLAPFIMALKSALISGELNSFQTADLPKLLKLIGRVAGPVFAVTSLDRSKIVYNDEELWFYYELLQEMLPALRTAISYGNGAISFRITDEVINAVPQEWLSLDRKVVRKVFGVFITRFLKSRTPRGMDNGAIETLDQLIGSWVRSQVLLESLFREHNLDKDRGIQVQRLREILNLNSTRMKYPSDRLAEMNAVLRWFKPLFLDDSGQITIAHSDIHTFNGLSNHVLFYQLSKHLVSVYSSVPEGDRAIERDVFAFTNDIKEFLIEIKFTDRVMSDDHKKRLFEADFFTYASNGDGGMDALEATYYIQYLVAISGVSEKIREKTERLCSTGKVDPIGWQWQNAVCFRENFFGNLQNHVQGLGGLRTYYDQLHINDKKKIANGIEFVGRRYGPNLLPVGNIDITGMVGGAYFIETVFTRFDLNSDGFLDTQEVMSMVPVFGKIIADIGGFKPEQTKWIEGALTYTVKFGETPQKTPGGIAKLLSWMAVREVGGVEAWGLKVSRKNIYSLIPSMVGPPLPMPDELPGYGPVDDSVR